MNVSSAQKPGSYGEAVVSKIKQVAEQEGEAIMKLVDSGSGPRTPTAPEGTGTLVDGYA